mmetsp:Transcript_7422/g.21742  ORF Transcript_7422/g.21742 Transcript_7422/m.21742 type:complete len:231 (+) Transcript_7422:169-861(+)
MQILRRCYPVRVICCMRAADVLCKRPAEGKLPPSTRAAATPTIIVLCFSEDCPTETPFQCCHRVEDVGAGRRLRGELPQPPLRRDGRGAQGHVTLRAERQPRVAFTQSDEALLNTRLDGSSSKAVSTSDEAAFARTVGPSAADVYQCPPTGLVERYDDPRMQVPVLMPLARHTALPDWLARLPPALSAVCRTEKPCRRRTTLAESHHCGGGRLVDGAPACEHFRQLYTYY